MSLNSVNTNVGAMIALQSLNKTNEQLAATQKRVSTGYRVADASDDGAAYAVAQSVRSSVGALTTVNEQLGNAQGLLSTTQSTLNHISETMKDMRQVLVDMGNSTGTKLTEYQDQYKKLLANVKSFIQDAAYSGKSLIGNIGGTITDAVVVRSDSGATYGIASHGMSAVYGSLVALSNFSGVSAANAQTDGGIFGTAFTAVGDALNAIGSDTKYINNQIAFNKDKIDALNSGLGSLVDADLAKESAQLQALQIRQQLGTQALSLANQAPQTLLSLFK